MDPPAESFLAETLAQARAYRALMVCDADVEYPPLAVVASGCIPAPIAYFRPSSSGGRGPIDFRLPAATAPGDGRVPLAKVLSSDPRISSPLIMWRVV